MKTATANSTALTTTIGVNTIALRPDQLQAAEQSLGTLDFEAITAAGITVLGHDAELALTHTLDGFLSGIDRTRSPQLFALFDRLQTGVADAKLPSLLANIQSGKLGWRARIKGLFSKKALAKAAHEAYENTRDLVAGRTHNLTGVMKGLEKELEQALHDLLAELQSLETLKGTYRDRIDDFAVAASVIRAFLEKARALVAQKRTDQASSSDVMGQSDLQEDEGKLQLLESRALALEGVYSRLPADQLVIQQIQAAGVQTLQETATTATTRFSSIKATLIALHGALQVKGVQQLTASHANLDRQLADIRGAIMKEVVTTAANAPGDNRIEQAKHLEQLITLTGEIQGLVSKAREENLKKFETARGMFAKARHELATLSIRTQSES